MCSVSSSEVVVAARATCCQKSATRLMSSTHCEQNSSQHERDVSMAANSCSYTLVIAVPDGDDDDVDYSDDDDDDGWKLIKLILSPRCM